MSIFIEFLKIYITLARVQTWIFLQFVTNIFINFTTKAFLLNYQDPIKNFL